jgi:clan AA aspartic protease (TIGR02281 family)
VTACANHADAEATGTCVDCLKTICSVCTAVSLETLCTKCARARRQRRTLRNGVLGFAAVAALVGLIFFLRRSTGAPAGQVDGGGYAQVTADVPVAFTTLDEELRREPCDRARAFKLVDGLYHASEPRLALQRADAFFQKCGAFHELTRITYAAHRDLSEWDPAVVDATKLIEERPSDKDYRWWRAQLYEQKGELELAARDYDQAIVLEPKITNIPFNLATVYERLGRPCESIFPLTQFAYHHPDAAEPANRRLQRLYADPACTGFQGTGRATIPYTPGSNAIPLRVRINAKLDATFVLDTGASVVVLPQRLANELGIDASGWPESVVVTAGGLRTVRRGLLDEVDLQTLRVRHVPCAISPDLPDGVGLLGLSFVSRFDVRFDAARGRITLTARGSGG